MVAQPSARSVIAQPRSRALTMRQLGIPN
jgi:hypothetical protein